MENNNGGERNFVPNVLPWVVAAAALLIYAATLNHWVSLTNMASVAKISGWSWEPEFFSPLYLLATYPLRWLPAEWIPLALNLFSAVCAVLVLGQLARSVALLPHDRTHEQRLREHGDYFMMSGFLSWLPPSLAAAACGLQLTFWEHGTNGSPEMLSLLVFSYVVRSLLEYRLDGHDGRLYRTVFIFGAGMANDWALVGFLPVFICAIGWIRGLSFFNFRFLTRIFLFGMAGLSLYLLLPCLAAGSSAHSAGFWLTLKTNLTTQKDFLFFFPRKIFVLFALTSLLPLLLLSIRWASYFGDSSQLGTVTATWVFHIVHAVFLLACLWMFFDPPFSPRHRGLELYYPFSTVSFLILYYLAALSVGYYCGYFLVVFQSAYSRGRRVVPVKGLPNALAHVLILSLTILVPTGLLWKNLPQIRFSNGPLLKEFAAAQTAELPDRGAILSDDPRTLALVRSWLVRVRKEKSFMLIDTRALSWPDYQRFLARNHPAQWRETPDLKREQLYSPKEIAHEILGLAKTEDLWYLQPSFGYYFEYFYPQPCGMTYQLKQYGTNALLPPALDSQLVDLNEKYWEKVIGSDLPPLLASLKFNTPQSPPSARQKLMDKFHLPMDPNATVTYIADCYSRNLNYWGTRVQAQQILVQAGKYFDLSLEAKPDNVVAEINRDANQLLRAGQNPTVVTTRALENQFEQYRSWDQVLDANGPYDEPNFCYAAGYTFLKGALYRQAAQQFERVSAMLTNNLPSRMLLAQIYLLARLPDDVLKMTGEIHNWPARFPLSSTNVVDLADLEASAQFQKKDTNAAITLLERAANSDTIAPENLGRIALIYWANGLYHQALKTLDHQLALIPGDLNILINKSYVYSLMKDYDHVILVLDEALKVDPDNAAALLDRAIALLRKGRLDEAAADYLKLQQLYPNARQTYFGLAEIAYERKDTNAALQNYEGYITNAPPGTPEFMLATNRLNELRGPKKP